MVAFYNAADQELYKKYQYLPQEKYRLGLNLPTDAPAPVVKDGIVNTDAFTNSGGGTRMTYDPNSLISNFQTAVDDRQSRLNKAYESPSTAKIFGVFPSFRQDVNPQDAGFYVGENMRIPQQRTIAGKFFQPQSAQEIMDQGYEPSFKLGILSNIMPDKFGNIKRPDQAFITSQMGYTGPTVFGENASGLGKDPFGLNTRSAFGNYAEAVGEQVSNLEKALGADGAIGGKKDFQNATFNFETNMFESDTLSKQDLAELNRRTNLVRTKLNFYRDKVKERDEFRRLDEERKKKEFDKPGGTGDQVADIQKRVYDQYEAQKKRDNKDFSVSGPDTSANPTGKSNQASAERGYALHGADGGRAIFEYGGLASIL